MRLQAFFLCFLPICLSAQYWDRNWMMGYDGGPPGGIWGGSMLRFTNTNVDTSRYPIDFFYAGSAYISDSDGELFMYSNGCEIKNATHNLMLNGSGLTIASPLYDQFCDPSYGAPTHAQLMLPSPRATTEYYYFYHSLYHIDDLAVGCYAKVDQMGDNGNGIVLEKNIAYTTDTVYSHLDAVRHANGRDWWLINGTFDGKGFTRHVLEPQGIVNMGRQDIGPVWKKPVYNGNSDMSRDGTRYVRQNPKNGTDLYFFDRCSGTFTYDRHLDFPSDTSFFTGVCFSPSGRYLYITTAWNVWQVDVTASNLMGSLTKVAEYDGFVDWTSAVFGFPELGPNGKIYIPTGNGTRYMHTIHEPDQAGLACDLRQHDIMLPTYSLQILMNTPNYRLFDLQGSPCDTLGINGYVEVEEPAQVIEQVYVYPNPVRAGEMVYAQSEAELVSVELYSSDGRLIEQKAAQGQVFGFDLPVQLPSGMYTAVITLNTGSRLLQKLVVVE